MPILSNRGVQPALGAALLFGASTPLAEGLLTTVSPQVPAGLLYLGSGLGLGAWWLWRVERATGGKRRLPGATSPGLPEPSDSADSWDRCWLLLGLSHTPASAASLLLNLEGVLTAALAWTVFREHVDRPCPGSGPRYCSASSDIG